MVDWATVALSTGGSLVGLLVALLFERRREVQARLARQDGVLDQIDRRVRNNETNLARFGPSVDFFNQLSAEGAWKHFPRRGGRR